jgi:hypothetical protein
LDKIIREKKLKDFTSDKKKIRADPVKLLVKLRSYRLIFKTIRKKKPLIILVFTSRLDLINIAGSPCRMSPLANLQGFRLDKRLGLVILISS